MIGTFTKGFVQRLEDFEIRGRVETIQTTVLLRSARIRRRVLETGCHSDSSGKLSANAGVKKLSLSLKIKKSHTTDYIKAKIDKTTE